MIKLIMVLITVVTVYAPWMLNGEMERPGRPDCGPCLWWDQYGVHTDCPQEVCAPQNFTAWWFNEWDDACNPPHITGQPEVRLTVDPTRVWSGRQAAQWFTCWRCQHAGISQRFNAKPGIYQAQAMYHSYYSSCDDQPYATQPLDNHCQPITDPYWQMWARIGIDPHCGSDPLDPSVVWSGEYHCHGEYCSMQSPPVLVQSCATVFIETRASAPLKHNDAFVDAIHLEKGP